MRFNAFGRKTDVEAMMLLGDFGVRVCGRKAVVIAPVRALSFADWTAQGLPFYGGAVTYHIDVQGTGEPAARLVDEIPLAGHRRRFGRRASRADRHLPLFRRHKARRAGPHRLDLTVYGNRYNTFGAVHNSDEEKDVYCSPNFWRSTGDTWAYEYQLRRTGPLAAPIVEALS